MNHIFVPATSTDDWRRLLAQPDKQWRSGFSAKELAECWERSDGFPTEFQRLFSESNYPALQKLELLLAIPEYQVHLVGGSRPSQNDLFVLARAEDGQLAAIMVEGKVSEPFGDTLEIWLRNASAGKKKRLQFLCGTLGLSNEPPSTIRYQLLHRTASAILEANRFGAKYAMMLVHSFSPEHQWFSDYQEFLQLFGVTCQVNELLELPQIGALQIFTGWVVGQPTMD